MPGQAQPLRVRHQAGDRIRTLRTRLQPLEPRAHHRRLLRRRGRLGGGGMPHHDDRRAATITAAEVRGRSKDSGTSEAGKYADIVAVDGDPLADINVMGKVTFVMKGGEVYKSVAQ